ncbi:hypothetical protein [Streptomyces sp900116325]|uniref:hypothetical protein n=1 Tax=Streptomyces sp. 900116325 TaxID=3154295 RepID=UPI0033A1F98E
MTTEALKALATIEDALPTLVRVIAQAAAAERRAEQAEAGGARAQRERAEAAERTASERLARLHRQRSDHDAHRGRLAAILAKPADTPLDELTEYAARTLTRNGERLLAAEQADRVAQSAARDAAAALIRAAEAEKRAAKLEADRDREAAAREEAQQDAERYKADHLAACRTIAEMHEAATGRTGMGPLLGVVEDVASTRAAFEAQRARADTLNRLCGEQRKRADTAEQRASKAEATLARIANARQSADVWTALGMHYGWTPEQAGQAARARRTAGELHARRTADRVMAERNRYQAAYRNARERATQRTEQRDRARKALHAWTDHTARIVADGDQLRTALADLARQEQQ